MNLGVSFFNSGYYNCNYWYGYYPTYTCGSGSFVSYIPFTVGPQVDFNLGGMNNISVGFNVFLGTATGTLYSGNLSQSVSKSVTIWEPTIDYVAKFGPPSQDTVGRFRIGGGMYIGPELRAGRRVPHRRRGLVPQHQPARHRPRPRPRGRRLQRLLDWRPAARRLARVPLLVVPLPRRSEIHMRKLLASLVAVLVATLANAQAPAKAPAPAGAAPAPVEVDNTGTPGKATAKRTAKATATITAIDAAARTVTLKAKSGETQTFKVGPDVKRFDEFAVGDVIKIEYEQGLALEFQPAGSENVPVPRSPRAVGRRRTRRPVPRPPQESGAR